MRVIRLNYFLALFCVVICFAACSISSKNKDIEKRLVKLDVGQAFTLDTINTADWDSVYVLTPYISGNFDAQEALAKCDIPKSVKDDIECVSMSDSYNTLLFFKNKKLVNYVRVTRSIVDFDWRDNRLHIYPSSQVYVVNEGREIGACY